MIWKRRLAALPEIVNLQFAMLSIIKLRSSVDEVHSVAQTMNNSQSAVGKLENSDGTTGATRGRQLECKNAKAKGTSRCAR